MGWPANRTNLEAYGILVSVVGFISSIVLPKFLLREGAAVQEVGDFRRGVLSHVEHPPVELEFSMVRSRRPRPSVTSTRACLASGSGVRP